MRDGENKLNLDRLWADYEQAFDTWALQVRRLKTLISWSSSSAVVREAELRVLAAECAYQESRDRLTEGLLQAEGETSSREGAFSAGQESHFVPSGASRRPC